MPTLTLPIPDDLHRTLAEQAQANGRSVEEEILRRASAGLHPAPGPKTEALGRLDALRARLAERGVTAMTDEELDAAIGDGRP